MEFRRINGMPPYVLGVINELKMQARRGGADVIDFGFGNPDLPSPEVAFEETMSFCTWPTPGTVVLRGTESSLSLPYPDAGLPLSEPASPSTAR